MHGLRALCGSLQASAQFGFHRFKPVLKPAILIACRGYGSSCFALFLDIGLPHAIWKPIVYWNHHSFLFEVAWCVMLYFSVTLFEVAPTVLAQYHFRRLASWFHTVTIPLVIIVITLSTLHHTSLGSLFLVAPARLHPLWFSSWIPALFFLSAVGAGMQMVILVMLGYSHFYQIGGNWVTLLSGQWEIAFFFAELLLGALVPIAVIAVPRARRSALGLLLASASAVLGLVLIRLNVGITGFLRTADATYFPTLAEFSLSMGILAMAALVFLYRIEHFRVFEDVPARDPARVTTRIGGYDPLGRVWCAFAPPTDPARVSLLVVVAAAASAGLFAANALNGIPLAPDPVGAPLPTWMPCTADASSAMSRKARPEAATKWPVARGVTAAAVHAARRQPTMTTPRIEKIGLVAHFSRHGDWAFASALATARRHNAVLNIFGFLESPYEAPLDVAPADRPTCEHNGQILLQRDRELREHYDEPLGDFVEAGFRVCESGRHNLELHLCLKRREFQLLFIPYLDHGVPFGNMPIEEFAYRFTAPVVLVGPTRPDQHHLNPPARIFVRCRRPAR